MRGNFLFALVILVLLFVPLERVFALRKRQRVFRQGWWTDLVHFVLTPFLTQAGLAVSFFSVVALLKPLVSVRLQAGVAAQPGWLQFLEAVVIADLMFYLGHRLAHEIPFLWRFHVVHHSIEEMDWLAAARVHPIDQVLLRTLAISPLFLLGFSRETFGLYLVLTRLQAIFIHSNVRLRFGLLRWLLATPEFHHWHHANHVESYNKNFAGQFPWLDRAFGTLHLPRNQMPEKYGTDEAVPRTYLKQLFYPFHSRTTCGLPGDAADPVGD